MKAINSPNLKYIRCSKTIMSDFHGYEFSPIAVAAGSTQTQAIIPATLTITASTGSERLHLTGCCMSVTRVAVGISQVLERTGGTILRCAAQTDGLHRHLDLEMQLPTLSILENLRSAIVCAGGVVERLQIDYGIRPVDDTTPTPDYRSEAYKNWYNSCPKACQNCKYYHGQRYGGNLLVCAIHPNGPSGDQCKDADVTLHKQEIKTAPTFDIRTYT